MKLISKIRHFLKPASIYQKVKNAYFKVAPEDSYVYRLTNAIIRRVLKKFQLLNIYYNRWIKAFDTLSEAERKKIELEIRAIENKPLISIVMPVYNPEIAFFEAAIQSVKDQLYPYWELCIADDASTDPRIPNLIKDLAREDQRIKFIIREENGHISACSNSALSLAKGDYIALLDHDDKLHPSAFFHVVRAINDNLDCRIIYSDEDKITKRGKRLDPYFKPDFDYDLLLSQNMISHLGVYRADVLRKIGGFRLGLEGSQDYDLLLRALEQIEPGQIHHIPKILYHWRISKHSVAESLNIKPYAVQAGERAINEHLERQAVDGKAEFLEKSAGYRINYAFPKPGPNIALILPANYGHGLHKNCTKEIFENTSYQNYQIIIIDQSDNLENSSFNLMEFDDRLSSYQIPEGKSTAQTINKIIHETPVDFVAILSPDLSGYSPGWLTTLISQAMQKEVGAVAPKLLNRKREVFSNGLILTPDNKINHLFQGKPEEFIGYFGWGKLRKGYSAFSEKCILVKRSHFLSVEGFDQDYTLPSAWTIDICLKFKEAGLRNVLCPSVKLYIQGNSDYNSEHDKTGNGNYLIDKNLLTSRWEKYFKRDPGFNPNLTIADDGEILVNLSPVTNKTGT
ncbi:MAG: glycosyltransferase [Brevefilum sp.]|nr:glycosyltransferase [Brevefilum sp.]